MSDNTEAFIDWNGRTGESWARLQVEFDRLTGPFGEAALAAAATRPGERALDVGCGCGDTSLALAGAVGSSGAVIGVDISKPMLEVARRRGADIPQLGFVEGDASVASLPGPFDLIFSRFGVMFFDDPVAAFSHMRKALGPAGRLAFTCWRAPGLNPWVSVPMQAVRTLLSIEAKGDPNAPGPFAFADGSRTGAILDAAGFAHVALDVFEAPIYLGRDARSAAEGVSRMGPVSRVIADAGPERLPDILEAIVKALEPHLTPQGVVLTGSTWIVTARAS